jgi:lipopolysaccharide/colanic/teichoic acid biosynthesis glycosyltransferase
MVSKPTGQERRKSSATRALAGLSSATASLSRSAPGVTPGLLLVPSSRGPVPHRPAGQAARHHGCHTSPPSTAAQRRSRPRLSRSRLALRALDLVALCFILPAILPAGLLVALFIKLVSRGPVFFRQERVGWHGSRFTLFKFRTMHVNADHSDHRNHTRQIIKSGVAMTKLDSRDHRLIRLGRLLRATGIDELPQLLNVLRGEMRLVGPRPCIPYEYEDYEPWQRRRCEAVPGLTGLWQVSGKNHTTFNEMIRLDIQYAENASVWLDLWILAQTIPAVWQQVRELRARPATTLRQPDSQLALQVSGETTQ